MSFILTAVLAVRLPLLVTTYDSAGIPGPALEAAQRSAALTLAAAGIEPIWRPCHAVGCAVTPTKARELNIRIVKAMGSADRGSLGFAFVDVERHEGTLATIYVDRVDALARQAGVDRGELLGRAIAHEIGHLILGTNGHTAFGLMRASWKTEELRRNLPLDWMFSGRDAAQMRNNLAAAADEADRARRFDPGTRVKITLSDNSRLERYFMLLASVELVVMNLDNVAALKDVVEHIPRSDVVAISQ